jgi:hypothetical protein
MEDLDFFWGFVSASLLWLVWNRYKIGPKKVEPCTFKWIGSLGRLGHTHECSLTHPHKINHICECGADIDHTPYDPANY